jgi:thioredoxin 1
MNEILNSQFNPSDYGIAVVDFWADWCMPCKMLLPILERFTSEFPSITFLKANVDENSALARDYGISNIPTMLVFKGGKLVDKITGLSRESYLRETFDKLISESATS